MTGGKIVADEEEQKSERQKEPWELTRSKFIVSLPEVNEAEEKFMSSIPKHDYAGQIVGYKPRTKEDEESDKLRVKWDTLTTKAMEKHKAAVAKALASGKPVPAEVLKDYPELGKREQVTQKKHRPLRDMSDAELKKLRVILRVLPDGTLWITEKGKDSLERNVAAWEPANRPDATEKSRIGGYILNERVADNSADWLHAVSERFDLDNDEIVSETWRAGGMRHKDSPFNFVKSSMAKQPSLSELNPNRAEVVNQTLVGGEEYDRRTKEIEEETRKMFEGAILTDKIIAGKRCWKNKEGYYFAREGEYPDLERIARQPSLSELKSAEESRSALSQSSDESRSNADTISPDSPRVARWLKDAGSSDIEGVDTPKRHTKSKPKKKAKTTSRQSTTLGRMR